MPSIFRNCNIDPTTGVIDKIDDNDNDIALLRADPIAAVAGDYRGSQSPPNSGLYTNLQGQFMARKVWSCVWNDYADFQLLCDELIPGKCYIDSADGAKIATERCQLSVIGVASNTFAHSVGTRGDQKQVPIAVAGWVLAYVDKEYPCGTPLTNDENGNLTEMTLEEKRNYPERLVATYKRKEMQERFGFQDSYIEVDNRHWVKVK